MSLKEVFDILCKIHSAQNYNQIKLNEVNLRSIKPLAVLAFIASSSIYNSGIRGLAARYFTELLFSDRDSKMDFASEYIFYQLQTNGNSIIRLGVVVGLGESKQYDRIHDFLLDPYYEVVQEAQSYLNLEDVK